MVRQERIGLHMADAVSRVTSGERIGVFAMQNGPGTENAFGGVAQAYGGVGADRRPARPATRGARSLRATSTRYLNFQHVTKAAEHVGQAANAPAALRRAFTQVRNGRPGPVLVELPHDVLAQTLPADAAYEPAPVTRSAPDPAAVDVGSRGARRRGPPGHLRRPGRPLREGVAGAAGARRAAGGRGHDQPRGKSAFPETHPLSLGTGGRTYPKPVIDFLGDCRRALRHRVPFARDALRRAVPERQDGHPRHPGPRRPEQGRPGPARARRRREADPRDADRGGAGPARRSAARAGRDGRRRDRARQRRRGCRTGERSSTTTRAR